MEFDEYLIRVGESVYGQYVTHGDSAIRNDIPKKKISINDDITELLSVEINECDDEWANEMMR